MRIKKLNIKALPDLLTVREVAGLFRVSPITIKRWGKRGTFPAIRINTRGDRRYKKDIILKLIDSSIRVDTNSILYVGTTTANTTFTHGGGGGDTYTGIPSGGGAVGNVNYPNEK